MQSQRAFESFTKLTQFDLINLWLDKGHIFNLSSNANLVFTHLLRFYNPTKKYVFPHQNTLAERCNTSVASVKRGLNELSKAGLIIKTRKKSGNIYGLTNKLFELLNSANCTIQTAQFELSHDYEQIKGTNKTTTSNVVSFNKDLQNREEEEGEASSTTVSPSFKSCNSELDIIPDILKKKAEKGEIKNLIGYWRSLRPAIQEEYREKDLLEKQQEEKKRAWAEQLEAEKKAKEEEERKLREELKKPLKEQYTYETAYNLVSKLYKIRPAFCQIGLARDLIREFNITFNREDI